MNARLLCLALVTGLALPVAAQAQMLAPGLWELTTSNMKVDNQDLPDLSLILGQLKQQMTPEQRAMLEKQGITMAGKGVQVCLTPAQVASDSIPLTDPQSGCKQEVTDKTGNQWKFRFSCPKPKARVWPLSKARRNSPPPSMAPSMPLASSRRAAWTPTPNGWATIAVPSNPALNARNAGAVPGSCRPPGRCTRPGGRTLTWC